MMSSVQSEVIGRGPAACSVGRPATLPRSAGLPTLEFAGAPCYHRPFLPQPGVLHLRRCAGRPRPRPSLGRRRQSQTDRPPRRPLQVSGEKSHSTDLGSRILRPLPQKTVSITWAGRPCDGYRIEARLGRPGQPGRAAMTCWLIHERSGAAWRPSPVPPVGLSVPSRFFCAPIFTSHYGLGGRQRGGRRKKGCGEWSSGCSS